jgi:L-fucose mutarotase/ribose pyranase (RbsD/FucU family)
MAVLRTQQLLLALQSSKKDKIISISELKFGTLDRTQTAHGVITTGGGSRYDAFQKVAYNNSRYS